MLLNKARKFAIDDQVKISDDVDHKYGEYRAGTQGRVSDSYVSTAYGEVIYEIEADLGYVLVREADLVPVKEEKKAV